MNTMERMASHGTWKYRITGIFFCLALLIGIMILSAQTASAGDYNVWVKGVRVTTDNASDVLGDGTVSYDAADKTLKLTNADLEVTSKRMSISTTVPHIMPVYSRIRI